MIKRFLLGALLGAATVWGGFSLYHPVALTRENSQIKVIPNGYSQEVFRINVPRDIVLDDSEQNPTPDNLDWSAASFLPGMQVNIFKIRDINGRVIGVASRMVSSDLAKERISEWLLHLPARGNIYVAMSGERTADGAYLGSIKQGTGNFEGVTGELTERFVKDAGLSLEPESAIELSFLTQSAGQAQ